MRINSLLTRCKQRAVHYLAMRTNSPVHFRNCPTTIFVRLKQIASVARACNAENLSQRNKYIPFPQAFALNNLSFRQNQQKISPSLCQ